MGTAVGKGLVSHHEYVVPLTVPLPIPAITPSWQEHSEEGALSPRLGIGPTLKSGMISATDGGKAKIQDTMTYVVMKHPEIAKTVSPFVELVSAQGISSPLVNPGGSAPGGQARGSARFQIDVNWGLLFPLATELPMTRKFITFETLFTGSSLLRTVDRLERPKK